MDSVGAIQKKVLAPKILKNFKIRKKFMAVLW
jgi:hypothetical protein